jgi:hypothetical protein
MTDCAWYESRPDVGSSARIRVSLENTSISSLPMHRRWGWRMGRRGVVRGCVIDKELDRTVAKNTSISSLPVHRRWEWEMRRRGVVKGLVRGYEDRNRVVGGVVRG